MIYEVKAYISNSVLGDLKSIIKDAMNDPRVGYEHPDYIQKEYAEEIAKLLDVEVRDE